jgi:hypothetical protein
MRRPRSPGVSATQTQLAEVFEVKWPGFNLRRGVSVLAVLLVPLIVLAVPA